MQGHATLYTTSVICVCLAVDSPLTLHKWLSPHCRFGGGVRKHHFTYLVVRLNPVGLPRNVIVSDLRLH